MLKKSTILGHRVLLKMETVKEAEKKSAGGILLDTEFTRHVEDSEIGVVVGIGSTAYNNLGDGNRWVEIGDRVVIVRHNGYKDPTDHTQRIVNDEDVLLKIEEE